MKKTLRGNNYIQRKALFFVVATATGRISFEIRGLGEKRESFGKRMTAAHE